MDNISILYFNFFIWFLTSVLYLKKIKKITLKVSILLLYTTISFVAIFLYQNPNAHFYFSTQLAIFPFIYLWIMIMLSLYPIEIMEKEKIYYLSFPSRKNINIICWIFIFLSLVKLIQMSNDLFNGSLFLKLQSDYIIDSYSNSTEARMNSKALSGGVDIISILANLSLSIIPLMFFIHLILPNRKKSITIGLSLSLLITPLEGLINSSRVGLIIQIFITIFSYLFFRDYLQIDIKKKFQKYFSYIVICVSFIFMTISINRAKFSDNNLTFSYQRYFAESILVFDSYCMNANGTREGHITIPLLKAILGEELLSESEMRYKYNYMSIDNSRFSTFVGDFVLDFGPILSAIIFILFSLIFSLLLKIKKSTITIEQIIIIFLVMRFNLGFYQYLYSTVGGNLVFLVLILLYLFFRLSKRKYLISIKDLNTVDS